MNVTIPADQLAAFNADYTKRLAGGLTADQALQTALQQLSSNTGIDPVSLQQALVTQSDPNTPTDPVT